LNLRNLQQGVNMQDIVFSKSVYYMASSVSGQDESNPAL